MSCQPGKYNFHIFGKMLKTNRSFCVLCINYIKFKKLVSLRVFFYNANKLFDDVIRIMTRSDIQMEIDKTSLLVAVSRMYYENNYTQAAIATKLSISRPYVSKLLQEAHAAGIVEIMIKDPMTHETSMEKKIRTHYHLTRVFVVPCNPGESYLTQVTYTAAKYLNSILASDDIIAISNGSTINSLANQVIHRSNLENLTVVQLTGSYINLSQQIAAAENVRTMAHAIGATPYALPLPVFTQTPHTLECLLKDSSIRFIRELQARANITIFSVGPIGTIGNDALISSGYISSDRFDSLINKGSVGDIFNHFIDKKGRIIDEELDSRCCSMPLGMLKDKKHSICLASGRSKLNVLKAALNGNYISTLIIDEELGKGILSGLKTT